ncbi:MAG: cysteine hydrolase [Desulfofustis sp.]|nr:cysteine hydrolase [Desulfofustis sp.]
METALLMIDIQNDYFPGGKMELVGSPEAGSNAGRVLARFRERGEPIVHIQHISTRPGASFFLPDTAGAAIHSSVEPAAGETVITKHFPNSFRDTALTDHLQSRQIRRLVVAGMMTHMCVDATVRAAFDLGFRRTVLNDACATRDLSFGSTAVPAEQVHAAFLAALEAVYAEVLSVDAFLAGEK